MPPRMINEEPDIVTTAFQLNAHGNQLALGPARAKTVSKAENPHILPSTK